MTDSKEEKKKEKKTNPFAISIQGVDFFYGDNQVLFDVNLDIPEKKVMAFIGPSGCGKSTLLRTLNRMNDLVEICKINGSIMLDSQDINDANQDPVLLRMKVGMVFQKPNPFPKSIYDNVAFGPTLHGMTKSKDELDQVVIESLTKSGLYDEVKDRLFEPGTGLSGTQDTTTGDHTQTLSVDASQTQITAIGTIATGTWQATAIADGYISSAATWNAKIANVVDDTTPQLGGDLDVNGKTVKYQFNMTNDNTDHYVFTDPGSIWFPTSENDPTLYLRRGEQYLFNNTSGGHPFRIQSTTGTSGTPYNTGVTNNGGTGQVIFKVPMSAPATLYYQCTSHTNMNGTINIV